MRFDWVWEFRRSFILNQTCSLQQYAEIRRNAQARGNTQKHPSKYPKQKHAGGFEKARKVPNLRCLTARKIKKTNRKEN